ncbi:Fic family protein [Candidatus Peregrinibacteria bacterium]|jgi:Fic family protein|nr:Fic family protein [Candidatus Peregrinibacteria bacterium]
MQFVVKKVIKGKAYYYMQYSKYGVYLGESVPANIKKKLMNFFIQIGKEEVKKLDEEIIKAFAPKKIEAIEVMRHLFILISRSELFSHEYQNYLTDLTVRFTFNSNRSEGSKVTRKEVENICLKNTRKPRSHIEREVFNSFSALRFAFSEKMNWNPLNVKRIHSLLLNNIADPLIVGKWKTQNVVAPGNQTTTNPEYVGDEMKKLFEWLKERKRAKMYPPLLATEFYIRFEAIHPFTDGNGRVGRILLNALLFHFDYMPIVFFTQNHEAHCRAITKAIEGRPGTFNRHFVEQAKKTIELIKIGLLI